MIVTISHIKLKSPSKFLLLTWHAIRSAWQLRFNKACVHYKTTGLLMAHYTISLWTNAEELKKFGHSGAHLDALKMTKFLAKEIRTFTYEDDKLPTWEEAKEKLSRGRVITFQ
jgi:hypothetical protein